MNRQKILFHLLDILGINALFRFLNRNKARVLWYHGICEDGFDLLQGYDERHVRKSLFREQLEYLKRKGYIFVTMSELVDALKSKKKVGKFVVLTFDDGFRNVVKNAYPIIRECGARGCFYLVFSLIGSNQLLWTDHIETVVRNSEAGEFQFTFKGQEIIYKLDTKESYEKAMQDIKDRLRTISDKERKEHIQQFADRKINNVPDEFYFSNWEQIENCDKRILEMGSHTVNHPNCANLSSDAELENEIRNSRIEIGEKIGYEVNHFCYPAGSYDDRVIECVKKYGYASATTIIPGFNDAKTDLYQLRRVFVGEDFNLFKANMSGSYFFISRLIKMMKWKK